MKVNGIRLGRAVTGTLGRGKSPRGASFSVAGRGKAPQRGRLSWDLRPRRSEPDEDEGDSAWTKGMACLQTASARPGVWCDWSQGIARDVGSVHRGP